MTKEQEKVNWLDSYIKNLQGWLSYELNDSKREVLETVIKNLNDIINLKIK